MIFLLPKLTLQALINLLASCQRGISSFSKQELLNKHRHGRIPLHPKAAAIGRCQEWDLGRSLANYMVNMTVAKIHCVSKACPTSLFFVWGCHMSHNQNPVLNWSTQGHVKNLEGGRSYFWLGSSLTSFICPGFDCDSHVCVPRW